jgi:hypothetical protein
MNDFMNKKKDSSRNVKDNDPEKRIEERMKFLGKILSDHSGDQVDTVEQPPVKQRRPSKRANSNAA